MPKFGGEILVGRISIYMTPDKEEMRWEAEYARTVYPSDCAVLYDLLCYKGEICSAAELEYIQRVLDAYYGKEENKEELTPDTLLKRI